MILRNPSYIYYSASLLQGNRPDYYKKSNSKHTKKQKERERDKVTNRDPPLLLSSECILLSYSSVFKYERQRKCIHEGRTWL